MTTQLDPSPLKEESNFSPAKQALLEKWKRAEFTSVPQTIPQRSEKERVPLSFAQQRLWFLDQLERNRVANNLFDNIHLVGALNALALKQSLNEIVQRHEALRTTFVVVNGQPAQVIVPTLTIELPIIDLQDMPEAKRKIEVQRLATEEAKRSFDLTQGPLLRVILLRVAPEEHFLLLTIHHIISDGWSMGILYRELSVLYQAFSAGKPSPLPKLSVQYPDFTLWQQTWLKGERLETQLNYWQKQLAGAPPLLELPVDRLRPAVQTFTGKKQTIVLSQILSNALKKLSQQQGATLFMALLAAFKILLYRYTGQEDIVVGSPVAGRNWPEVEPVIGFFVNILVLRTHLSGEPTFQELLSRVRKTALQAYTHQDIPFERLLEELQPERNLSHTPLFQVFFNMTNFEDTQLNLPELTTDHLPSPEPSSPFDLTLYVREKNGCIRLKLVYNAHLFAPARMTEMLRQYEYLLRQIVENPQTRLSQFSLVTSTARQYLPDPTVPLQADWKGAIHHQFSQRAQQRPNHLAAVDPQETWTYQELEIRSNQLAHYLRASGIKNQDIVAIYGHRSASLVWALLGVLKAGAAFMILDPAHPASRLINCVNAAKPRGWIQLESAGLLSNDLKKFIINLSYRVYLTLPTREKAETRNFLSNYSSQNLGVTIGPDDLAYVAFTSGSTGLPKGVLGRHGPLSHFLPWQVKKFALGPSDRFSMLSGLSHDPLQREIFTALWVGATICIPSPNFTKITGLLANWMAQAKITFAHLTPAMGQILTETATSDDWLPALRYAFFVGDKLTRRDVARLQHLAPNVTCINSFGSTETQRAVSYYIIPPRQKPTGEQVKAIYCLGCGMPNVQLLVLNPAQQLAGVGELGEIYIRSPHLAHGYLKDTALTQTRFLTNPFAGIAKDRLYRTGDLGRYLPDGNVEFAGRADRQLKIRGFRIEPGEIEETLVQHPAIHEAVILTHEGRSGKRHLVAYIIPQKGPVPASNELHLFLKHKLPDYMVPSAFVTLNSLPLTPNGKIDYQALPEPAPLRPELQSTFVAPRNLTERQLVKIWEEVLEIKPIGVRDNFFELGGHSLLAIRLFAKIEKILGKNLPLVSLFQKATIEHLANIITRQPSLTNWSSLVELQPHGLKPPFFCVHGLTGDVLWFADLARYLGPEQPFYGLQAQGLDGTQQPFTQIESMAAHYIKELRTLQPNGPYFLGGASFGGTVAFEMAQQLQAQGDSVALLVTFDHAPPNRVDAADQPSAGRWRFVFKTLRNFPYWLSSFVQLTPEQMLARIRRKARVARKRLGKKLNLRNIELDQIDAADIIDYASELPEHRRRVIEAHYRAFKSYVPQTYPGCVTLFLARSRPIVNGRDLEARWKKLATDGVEVKGVPGSHEGMFKEPYVRVLAERLKSSLEQAQSQSLKELL